MNTFTININAPIHIHNCPMADPDTLLRLMELLGDDEFDYDDADFNEGEEMEDAPDASEEEDDDLPIVLGIKLPKDISPDDLTPADMEKIAKIALTALFHPDEMDGENHGRA